MDSSLSITPITSLLDYHKIIAVACVVDEDLLPNASIPVIAIARVVNDHHLVLPAHPIVIVYDNFLPPPEWPSRLFDDHSVASTVVIPEPISIHDLFVVLLSYTIDLKINIYTHSDLLFSQ